jgi:hypothetical protein
MEMKMTEEEEYELDRLAFELEREWKRTSSRYNDKELLAIFPDARKIIPQKLEEREQEYKLLRNEIRAFLKRIREENFESLWFAEEIAKVFYFPDLFACERHIYRLRRMKFVAEGSNKKYCKENFYENIELARSYPIFQVAREKLELKKSGNNYSALCPFHNEKTPSFYIYVEDNQYHCFGCGVHGDVINLAQHLYGLSFKQTIELLTN